MFSALDGLYCIEKGGKCTDRTKEVIWRLKQLSKPIIHKQRGDFDNGFLCKDDMDIRRKLNGFSEKKRAPSRMENREMVSMCQHQ